MVLIKSDHLDTLVGVQSLRIKGGTMGSGSDEGRKSTRVYSGQLEKVTGAKNDKGKPPLALIPKEFLDEVALAFDYGRQVYGQYNFTNGLEVTRLLDAAMRHITAYAWGEDKAADSNVNHLGHAGASLAMALFMIKYKPELDDRFKKPK